MREDRGGGAAEEARGGRGEERRSESGGGCLLRCRVVDSRDIDFHDYLKKPVHVFA